MLYILKEPWPWYVSGPLVGLIVPILLLSSNKQFGVSSVFRHVCTATKLSKKSYFQYDLKKEYWSLLFVLGIVIAGVFAFHLIEVLPGELSKDAQVYYQSKNIEFTGYFPIGLYRWDTLFSVFGLVLAAGGVFIGFGTRYANGCTSGHAITGLSLLSLGSLIAVIGFFIGGLIGTFLILDNIL
ncbi:MAG: YeeE/YedE family protein [Vicingus serpentipes]|nr:YeeE/YedE family protein [Vicingus serpentipes]